MSGYCHHRAGLVALAFTAALAVAVAGDAYHGEGEAPDYDARGWMGTR